MLSKISDHPALTHAEDVKIICQPLEKLNINYFSHAQVDKSNLLSGIASHPVYFEHYLRNKHYDIDIHTAHSKTLGTQIMWDNIELQGKCALENEEAAQFGIEHVFTIIEHELNVTHYYHFASNKMGTAINQIYLNHIDLLKLFIVYFKEKTTNHKILRQAYNLKFPIDNETEGFLIKDHISPANETRLKSDFLKSVQLPPPFFQGSKILSMREKEVLTWLHYGKTTHQIAQILNIADITVNKHIANIKEKTQCYTQFQLGEFFAKNICDSN